MKICLINRDCCVYSFTSIHFLFMLLLKVLNMRANKKMNPNSMCEVLSSESECDECPLSKSNDYAMKFIRRIR